LVRFTTHNDFLLQRTHPGLQETTMTRTPLAASILAATIGLVACGGNENLPQLTAAQGTGLLSCTGLSNSFSHAGTTIGAASVVSAGTLKNGGSDVNEHCLVTGKMNPRVSSVDGRNYAIQFEMRLPKDWNGRFLYQGNGGTDGVVSPAVGNFSGGGMLRHALQQGFAVISSDAGHSAAQNPLFGLDPQARLDYGYQAVGTLTAMAKNLIKAAYGKLPDRSYIGGTSNGGRHAMVAAARYANDFDGYLAGSPGFNLPKAAVAQLYGAQQWAKVATERTNLETGFNATERRMVATAVLARCDQLDGVADGLVEDVEACRRAFDLQPDVPTCSSVRDGTCLSAEQKNAFNQVMTGARNSKGELLYAGWPYDPGMRTSGWADWKFKNSVGATRDPVAVAFIFSSPPASDSIMGDTLSYALNFNMDVDAPRIFATSGLYAESAMSFMTPPNPTKLNAMRDRGAKMIVFHGNADPVFQSMTPRPGTTHSTPSPASQPTALFAFSESLAWVTRAVDRPRTSLTLCRPWWIGWNLARRPTRWWPQHAARATQGGSTAICPAIGVPGAHGPCVLIL
jgi:feruloyl esterase